jgi:hypothetical protein
LRTVTAWRTVERAMLLTAHITMLQAHGATLVSCWPDELAARTPEPISGT